MGKIVEVFINWQVLLISFAAFALLSVIRSVGTKKLPDGRISGGFAQSAPFKMFLPVYPYVLTFIILFIPGAPMPEVAEKTPALQVIYSIYAGWLSGFSFQLVKKVLEDGFKLKFGADK